MILILAILTSVLLIAGMMRFLLKDFFKFIVKKTSLARLPKTFIDFGEYFATWLFIIMIAVLGFTFYKFEIALAAYLLSDDLTSFFIILRGVFTVKTELQNPFIIQHMIAGFILTPALQFVACYMIYKSIKSFMVFVNRKYGNHTYNESDLIYFSFIAVLVFMLFEIVSYSQNIPAISGFAHFIYLGVSKLSFVCFFISIAHNSLLRSHEYKRSLPEYVKLNSIQEKIILSPVRNIVLTYFIGVILNIPFVLGTQFLKNNLQVIFVCMVSCAAFYLVLKIFLAKGYNYFGAIIFHHRVNIETILSGSEQASLNLKRKMLIATGILFLLLIVSNIKIFFSLIFTGVFLAVLIFLFYSFGYFAFLGGSIIRAKLYKAVVPPVSKAGWNYIIITVKAFAKSTYLLVLFILSVIIMLSIFPKRYEYQTDDTYVSSVLDDAGNPLYIRYNDDNSSIPISYKQLPEFMVKMLLIQEDRDFLNQNSWLPSLSNWHGLSIASLYRSFTGSGGGSNLNNQLIKNVAFPNGFPVDIQRKFAEMASSFQLSLQLSPEEIATQYFNKVGWNGGNTHSGIMMGCLYTFGVPVEKLNQLEMLYMVRSLKRGSTFKTGDSLINYQDASLYAKDIKKSLLEQATSWHNQNLITKKELNALKNKELRFVNTKYQPASETSTKEFFSSQLLKNNKNYGTYQSTISLAHIQAMQAAVKDFNSEFSQFQKIDSYDLFSAALVINVSTGEIIGHYGSKGITDLTTLSPGSDMGSLMKPFILCELLEFGFFANDILLYDGPINGQPTPQNYSRNYSYKNVGIDEALGRSLNAPLVNVRMIAEPIGLFNNAENHFAQMNIASDPYLQLNNLQKRKENILNYPLGSRNMNLLDITQAYQTLFNGGEYIKLSTLNNYYDPYKDTTIAIPKIRKQIYSVANANRIKAALHHALMERGTANHLNKILLTKRKMYSKTGTTHKERTGYCVISDGEILVISFVSYGQVIGNQLKLGLAPIPFLSGGKSAGVLSAFIYNEFVKAK